MYALFKATPASATLAAALALFPLSLFAQEGDFGDAGTPGAASDPPDSDDGLPPEDATAEPATNGDADPSETVSPGDDPAAEGATTEGRQTDTATEEESPEVAADGAEDDLGNRERFAATLEASEEAAIAIRDAAERLPPIIDRIDALVTEVEALPLEELVTELRSLASSANRLVSSEETQALPADLSSALAEAEALLRDLREGGLVDNANATLQSTRAAADTLPGLAERAAVLLDQAGGAIEGFQGSDSILREAERAIRDVSDAAEAVASLARAIERDPNSLLFGR